MVPAPVYQVVEAFLDGKGPATSKKESLKCCATFCIEVMRVPFEEELVLVSQRSVSSTNRSSWTFGGFGITRTRCLESCGVSAECVKQDAANAEPDAGRCSAALEHS